MKHLLGSIVLLVFAPALCAQQVDTLAVETVVRDALKSWHVPGTAVAIVHHDRIIYLKGHGVRRIGESGPVTPDTVFPLASCTKPFTTLAMAMLVDEGKLHWDDPVRKHVPFFRLSDALANESVTLRDLVTHRTGMAAHDLLWYRAPWALEERIRKIGMLPGKHSFRSQFEYHSILFGSAGYAAGRAVGTTWQDLIEKRIFQALGMKSVACTTAVAQRFQHASPHRKKQGKVEVAQEYSLDEPDPAGSIHASARDLTRFLRFQLGDGSWEGRRLVSAEQLAEMHAAQIVIHGDDFTRAMNPHTAFLCYGLGWIVQDYRGQVLWMHGGAIDGFRAHFTLVPHAKLGIVLLNNLDRTQMNLALSNTLVDMLLNLPYKDWNAYYGQIMEADDRRQAEAIKTIWEQRNKNSKPTLPLTDYTGTYEDKVYGRIAVSFEGNGLVWQWSGFRCPLKHFENDVFMIESDTLMNARLTFSAERSVTKLRFNERDFARVK